MLHKVNPPNCLEDMKKLLKYQRRFLRLCLFSPDPLTEAICINHFGDAIGNWTWQRICRGQKQTNFGQIVEKLCLYARQNQNQASTVYKLICTDQQFSIKRNNPNFYFLYPSFSTTHPQWHEKLSDFLIVFYDFFHKGYPTRIFQFKQGDLSWHSFMDAQYEANPFVCPYCDDSQGDKTRKIDANDAEHWLPKSIYPHLSIHWANLFRACMPCNERFKGDDNPIKHSGAGELNKTYHPYSKPALPTANISVSIQANAPFQYNLCLEDIQNPECATALESMLSLSERWGGRLNPKLKRDKSALVADEIITESIRGRAICCNWLRETLQIKKTVCERLVSTNANALIESALLGYQVQHQVDEIYQALRYAHQ